MPAGFVNAGDYSADASGLNAAAAAAGAASKGLWIPKRSGGYTISSTVTVPANVRVEQFAEIVYTGSTSTPALVWGGAAVANEQSVWRGLNVSRSPSWGNSYDGVGIRLYNAQDCQLVLLRSRGFDVGVQILGEGAEARGTWLEAGSLQECRIGYHLCSRTGGRVRDNRIMGGRQIQLGTVVDGTYPRYHYVTDSDGGTAADDVGNLLIGSFADFRADQTTGECAAFWLKTPYNFCWYVGVDANLRSGGHPIAIVDGPAAHHNTVWLGYDTADVFGASDVLSRNRAPSTNAGLSIRSIDPSGVGGFNF